MPGHRPTFPRTRIALAALLSVALAAPAASGDTKAKNHVRKVGVHLLTGAALDAVSAPRSSGGVTEVEIALSGPPQYTARLDDGRLLVDLTDAEVDATVATITEKTGVVGGVLTQTASSGGATLSRVSIALTRAATYRVRVDGNTLRVWLTPTEAEVASGPASVTDVRYVHESGADKVVVTMTGKPVYATKPDVAGKVKLELTGAKLPESLERTLDVAAFKGLVTSVTTTHEKTGVVLEAEKLGGASADVKVEEKDGSSTLTWTFRRAGDEAKPETGAVRKVRTITTESGDDAAASAFLGTVPMQTAPGRFGGRRIDLDFKDADIHNILRLLADVGKVNIVTADDVSGSVTIKMKNVPWDQALDVVLQAKGLGMVRTGNLIRVARADSLRKERDDALAKRKAELDLAPIETRLIPVSYANASDLSQKANVLKSPRGSIAIDERTNVLIVRDVAGALDQIEALVHSLDTQTPEVLVEARIVEATSRYLRDVGIQWGGDLSFSGATGNPTGLAFPSSVGLNGGASDTNTPTAGLSPTASTVPNPNFAVNLPAAVGTGSGGAIGLTLGSINNIANLALRLSAAETNGMVRIVSSPRILTLDNREAEVSQGTLIPFSQISAQGVQTTFQEAKLALKVKPHVTADGSIAMHVKVTRDEPDFTQTSARGDPTILKRLAETDLLIPDGSTVVIGGIYTRNTGRSIDQVPLFGSIPIIGVLFQHRKVSDTRTELVVFLTPRIVNRAEALGK
jgi:type IV pilus assembly protein PilQ